MTGKLQITDLVVNGPYKAAIRRKRIANLFNYFQSWKFKRLQELVKPIAERALPPFDPPKPTLATGLLQSFKVERELFAKDSFKQAIKSTFVQAGQAAQADGTFVTYKSHERHTISRDLLRLGKPEDNSLAMIGDTDVATYEEDEEPETDDEEETRRSRCRERGRKRGRESGSEIDREIGSGERQASGGRRQRLTCAYDSRLQPPVRSGEQY